ncbi:hypothetical protein [Brevibacillus aydinogluensis]|uniref:hypothetical protein n=1 Tax=Brevibacillus aydinogluensis TaxID=927786 RepID=UPI0026F3F45D|nr:hypothetical protein [Brevibacillus aydinogluensis]
MKKRTWMVVGMFAVAAIAGGSFYGAEDANASKMTADVKQADKMKIHRSKETNPKKQMKRLRRPGRVPKRLLRLMIVVGRSMTMLIAPILQRQ